MDIEINKDMADKRNYKVRFNKISKYLGFKCKRKVLDEIITMKESILSATGINIEDPKFSNYRTFIGVEAS